MVTHNSLYFFYSTCSGVAMGLGRVGKVQGPPSVGAPEFQANFKKIIFLYKLEIRSVERGLCPIASPQRPNCSYNI